MADLPDVIFRRWTHVREEDTTDIQVYRPTDRPLPPARIREGLEFRRDGTVVRFGSGPSDALVDTATVRWSSELSRRVVLRTDDGSVVSRFEIDVVTEDVLRLRSAPTADSAHRE